MVLERSLERRKGAESLFFLLMSCGQGSPRTVRFFMIVIEKFENSSLCLDERDAEIHFRELSLQSGSYSGLTEHRTGLNFSGVAKSVVRRV